MKTQSSTVSALALLLLITVALCQGCKKDDSLPWPLSALPPATQTGENTFGCLINGEPYVPERKISIPFGRELEAYYDEPNYGGEYDNRFSIRTDNIQSASTASYFSIGLYPVFLSDVYNIDNTDFFSAGATIKIAGDSKHYVLDTLVFHTITISKLDTAKNIASGTFEMDMRRVSDSTDILQIRHGRFDVRYFPE